MKKNKKKSVEHYIDNEEFLLKMNNWKVEVQKAKDSGDKLPPVTEYIGLCFLKIAERLSLRPNFSKYPFRDDMIGDGVENCLMYASNFDAEKSSNPFSYFTQIIYFAFIRRIQKEKKQEYIKYKYLDVLDKTGEVRATLRNSTYSNEKPGGGLYNLSDDAILGFENKKSRKKKANRKSVTNLDELIED